MNVAQIKSIIDNSTTFDGRIAPDYTDSYVLKRALDELVDKAQAYEDSMTAEVAND